MVSLGLVFVAAWLTVALAPTTPAARFLHQLLVAAPAARLSRITRGDVATAFLLTVAAGMIAFVGEGDGIRLLTMAAPDVGIWLTTFEVSAYIDIIMAAALAASNLRVRSLAARILAGRTAHVLRRGRKARETRTSATKAPTSANDGDDLSDRILLAVA